jgi:hypothetical protein
MRRTGVMLAPFAVDRPVFRDQQSRFRVMKLEYVPDLGAIEIDPVDALRELASETHFHTQLAQTATIMPATDEPGDVAAPIVARS